MINFCVEVVCVNKAGKLYFLNLNGFLLLTGFFLFFITVKKEFTVIHYFAYRRLSLRCDLYQIQTLFVCEQLCFPRIHNAQLRSIRSYKAKLLVTYLFVNLQFILSYG